MAKQTFTTGQVLTAAQMTSLQQTAMGGGSTTAKTTSYVLVAADAGTVVQMNAAGATTITVNTALFAAGDTVQIQNVGAGVCTITAGTATVSTSAVLTLKQYDAGILYFNSTSAAIFFSSDAADSPLTTKGDLFTYSTINDRLGVGTNGQTLVADSTASTGLKWATPASGSTFVGASVYKSAAQTISTATATYLTFPNELYDTNAFHDNSTNNSRLTVPSGKAGKYLLSANTAWRNNATGQRTMYIYKNGTTLLNAVTIPGVSASIDVYATTSYVADLAVGDYVEMQVYQNSGGNLDVLWETYASSFQISYLGA
jgi:hypothetical protein